MSIRSNSLSRRDWLRATATTGLVLGSGIVRPGALHAQQQVSGKPGPGKIGEFKISLAEWSLHKRLFDSGNAAQMNLDFPKMAKEEFGIDAVEFVNQFFKDHAHDTAYLRDLKKRADDHGVTCVLIMIDREGDLSATDKAERTKAVENHTKWVDAAVALGCHAIRVNTGNNYSPTSNADVTEGCSALADYGAAHKINIICENHGGPSSDPNSLIPLMKSVNKPNFGTLPDFGNFARNGDKYAIDVYDAIAQMMPYAKGVSAKSFAFGPDGKETTLDFARILKIVTDSGYHGYVGIEFEGGSPEPEGIRATKKLLETLRGSEYKG